MQPECAVCVCGPQEEVSGSRKGRTAGGAPGGRIFQLSHGALHQMIIASDPSETPALCVQGPEGRNGMNQR